MTRMDREPLPDYSSTIRAEIEREVEDLKRAIGHGHQRWLGGGGGWSTDYIQAQYVGVGSLINLHHGRPVLSAGDMVAGLPVRINTLWPRSIAVRADDVEFTRVDEEGLEETYRRDLVEQNTW